MSVFAESVLAAGVRGGSTKFCVICEVPPGCLGFCATDTAPSMAITITAAASRRSSPIHRGERDASTKAPPYVE
jgi:hypothetical protein